MSSFVKEGLPDPVAYFEAEGLTLTGKGKWRTAACNFHGGSDSMRINTVTGAWVCMACNAKGGDVLGHFMAEHGLDFVTAAKALGAWRNDGKPSRPQRPRPLPAIDAIRVLALESTLTAIAAGNIANGVQLTTDDRARLYIASQRIAHIAEAFV